MATVRTGGCLCGKIRYECSGEPAFSLLCHCRDCQRQSGSAFIAAARMPASGFRITQGEPRRYVSKSDSGNDVTRIFCGDCGGPLYIQVSTRPDLIETQGHDARRPELVPARRQHLHQKRPALGSPSTPAAPRATRPIPWGRPTP